MKTPILPLLALLCIAATAGAAEFDIRDSDQFARLIAADAKITKLAGDLGFTEGPVWVPSNGGYLVFSDIPNNTLHQWTAAGGLTVFRRPSHKANGNTVDREGRLVSCEHDGRRIARLEKDGTLVTVVDTYEGKKLNSPNDVVVKSDGTIWFTDPDYGLPNTPDRKGKVGKELPANYVFRFDPRTRALTAVVKDCDKPNGLVFSPDEKKLYVADSGAPRHIRVFDVKADGTLSGGAVFCQIDQGAPDGIRMDRLGNVWSSAGDGVQIFAPSGKLIGKILTPEAAANLCFGGADGRTLFITARKSLYAIETRVTAPK
jgi:gluconolactonase